MKPDQNLLNALNDVTLESLFAHLDLTDPDVKDYKIVDLKPAIKAMNACVRKMKAFEAQKK